MKKKKNRARMPKQQTLEGLELTKSDIDTLRRFKKQTGKRTKDEEREYKNAVAKAKDLIQKLNDMKEVYRTMDKLTDFLVGFPVEKLAKDGLIVHDNFEKNVAWKSTAFKRFELKRAGGEK